MPDETYRPNIEFFTAVSMHQLYADMRAWQVANRARFISLSIQGGQPGWYNAIAVIARDETTPVVEVRPGKGGRPALE